MRELYFCEVKREDICDVVHSLDWPRWLTPETTFKVTFNVHSSLLRSPRFGVVPDQDAICDRMVELVGQRPSVDTEAGDVHVVYRRTAASRWGWTAPGHRCTCAATA
ncbi:MAG: hypothetical protein IPP62_15535 [bacterium]|nr:hypothetical protein [bacterium]